MDDLDHSMHIAEYDWTSFYEDSEECDLLQPSLACPDNVSLSDSEDSSSVFNRGQRELQQSDAANSHEAAGCCVEEVLISLRGSGGEQDDLAPKDSERQVKSEIRLDCPEGNSINTELNVRTAEHITEVTNDNIAATLQTEQLCVQSSERESTELKTETESDTSSLHEPDPLSHDGAGLNVNEPHTTDRAVGGDVSGVASRAEKERWFVTVNDSPARQRAHATSVKKKRRQKKLRKNNHVHRTPGREKSGENGLELEISRDNNESEGGGDKEYATQSNQSSGGHPSAEDDPESVQMGVMSDSSQVSLMSGEEDIARPTTDKNKHDPSSSASTSPDISTPKDPSRLDSVESDELGDSVEFLSTHSCESQSYQSATESVEEPQHPLIGNQQLQSSPSLIENIHLFSRTDVDDTQDREMHSCHSPLSCSVTAANCEGYESTNAEPNLTSPSAAQRADKMPDDDSVVDNITRSTPLRTPSDAPGLQKHDIRLSASGCSSGDQLSLPPVPDVTLTPCSVASSPEAYVKATGHTRPVFAISAFWDEMEKLTINDILQLRMDRSTPPRDTQETVTPNVDDFPPNHSSLVDTVEYNLSDGGLMDTSDTADSDYFTQPDESKPDRSSCEFSTSDFEEEYWQFLGTSRNPSPDPQSKNQQRTSYSAFTAHEEEESTSSEGKETPVPSEDFTGQCLEDQDSNSFISGELGCPRRITKSKSVRNVRALNTEDVSLQLLPGNDESSLFLSSCPPLEESETLGTLVPAPCLSNTDVLDEHTPISFPQVFEYFFTDNEAKTDSRCVTIYDPEDISLAPLFRYTLRTFSDETSFSSLRDCQRSEEKPIPIFSCSHPTVRELTFPRSEYVLLSSDCEAEADISPIRVVSHSFIQGVDWGASAADPRGIDCWKSLLSVRKIRFHDKGSIWCRGSGAWVFPVKADKITIKGTDPPVPVLTDRSISTTPSQLCRELAVEQRILETTQTASKSELFHSLDWMKKHIESKTTLECVLLSCACLCLEQDERASSPH